MTNLTAVEFYTCRKYLSGGLGDIIYANLDGWSWWGQWLRWSDVSTLQLTGCPGVLIAITARSIQEQYRPVVRCDE